jgi:hypothetical protein
VREIHVVGHSLGKLPRPQALSSKLTSRGCSRSDCGDLSASADRMGGRQSDREGIRDPQDWE